MKTPFIHLVPTDIVKNLRWRSKVHRRVIEDPSYAEVIWDACALDPLFYICGFGYALEPRAEPFSKLPFILYPYQRQGLLEIFNAINKHDLLIEKSRDTGASWMCVLAFEWIWHFGTTRRTFLMGSRNENYVDCTENPKALFQKIDFFHENLPPWLMPSGFNHIDHRRKMHLINPANRSVIDGETTTKHFARGDRRTAILLDEFAADENGYAVKSATLRATKSRIFNSTPLGQRGAFFDLRQTNIKKLRLFWADHPEKRKGLYTTDEEGKLKILDEENYPKDYQPILDGKLRSIEYDCDESRSSPREMAQEWDIDYAGSGAPFFDASAIQGAIQKYARPPVVRGDLEYDNITAEVIGFREDSNGKILLWCLLDKDGNIAKDHGKVLGADVSAGTGSSNSCLVGYDAVTHEKLLEYANPYIRPEEFAKQAVAIARWLGKAYLVWESNGPGRQFGSRVIELGYNNVYLRRREEAISKKISQEQIPGLASTKETKLVFVGAYRAAIEKGMCINRSKRALEECLEYVYDPRGGVSHAKADSKEDPSGARSNHGDRVIADALAWHGLADKIKKPEQQKPEVPVGSLAWRRKLRMSNKPRRGRELSRKDGW